MEKKKEIAVLQAHSLRDLVQEINNNGIQKDDIVKLLDKDEEGYILLYYK